MGLTRWLKSWIEGLTRSSNSTELRFLRRKMPRTFECTINNMYAPLGNEMGFSSDPSFQLSFSKNSTRPIRSWSKFNSSLHSAISLDGLLYSTFTYPVEVWQATLQHRLFKRIALQHCCLPDRLEFGQSLTGRSTASSSQTGRSTALSPTWPTKSWSKFDMLLHSVVFLDGLLYSIIIYLVD